MKLTCHLKESRLLCLQPMTKSFKLKFSLSNEESGESDFFPTLKEFYEKMATDELPQKIVNSIVRASSKRVVR